MNTDQTEKIILYLLGELSEAEKQALENTLKYSLDAQHEFNKQQQLFEQIKKHHLTVSDDLLKQARTRLQHVLNSKLETQNRIDRFFEQVGSWFSAFFEDRSLPRFAIILGSILLFVLGGAIGYIGSMVSMYSIQSPIVKLTKAVQIDDLFSQRNVSFQNIRFISENTETGELSIALDAVSSLSINGKPNDAIIRKILSYTLLQSTNAGVKIQTLAIIKSLDSTSYDKSLKYALIKAMCFDPNAGVRREAMSIIKLYPIDQEVKESFIYTLNNDDNPGLRVEAINTLSELSKKMPDEFLTEDFHNILKSTVNDANQYIRIKSKQLLKELKL